MSVSPGPFITCLLTAFVLNVYIFFIIHVKKDIFYEGMKFTFSVIVLILLRMMMPLNFPFTITIPSSKILPWFNKVLFYNIGGTGIEVCHVMAVIWLAEAVRRLIKMIRDNREYRNFLEPFKVEDLSEYPEVLSLLEEYQVPSLKVCIVPAPVSPELFGAWNTILVLPKDILSKEELDFACRHELEHFKNHDLWLKLLVDLAACIQWFNILAHVLQKELVLAFEMSNDRKVLRGYTEDERIDYIACITRISRMQSNNGVKQRGLAFTKLNDLNLKLRTNFLIAKDYGKTGKPAVSIFIRYILAMLMLVVSLIYVPEGHSGEKAVADGAEKVHENNSYLIKCEDGYKLYLNGKYLYTCSTIHEEFSDLPVIEEEELK